jgi:hypothetical protein
MSRSAPQDPLVPIMLPQTHLELIIRTLEQTAEALADGPTGDGRPLSRRLAKVAAELRSQLDAQHS